MVVNRKVKGPGEPDQVEALVKAVRDHKGFKQMAQYNVMCLISHISPPAVGWMQNVKYAVESGAIEAIIEVLKAHPGALEVVRTSIEALRKLATDTRNAELLAKAGAVGAALDAMLKSDDDGVADEGGGLISTIAAHKPDAITKSSGTVSALVGALNSNAKLKVLSSVLNTLDRVCRTDMGEVETKKAGGIKNLVLSMQKGKETSEETLLPTFRILERFAANDPKTIKDMKAEGALQNIVHQLEVHSNNDAVLRAGGRILGQIAMDDLEDTINQLNNSSLSPETRKFLTALISNLALRPENVEKIVKGGGIKALISGYADFTPETKEAAAKAFGRIALANEENVQKLFEAGVHTTLVPHAVEKAGDNEGLLAAGTYALANMATTKENGKKLEDAGAGAAILKKSKEFPMKEGFVAESLKFWENLGKNNNDLTPHVKNGLTPFVLDAMRENPMNAEIQRRGFTTLEHTLRDQENGGKSGAEVAKEIAAKGGLKQMGQALATHGGNGDVAMAGFKALLEYWERDAKNAGKQFAEAKVIGSILNCAYMQHLAGNKKMDELIRGMVIKMIPPKEAEDIVAEIKKATMTLCSTKSDEAADRLEEKLRVATVLCKSKAHADAIAKASGPVVFLACWHDALQIREDCPRLGDIMEVFAMAVLSLGRSDRKHLRALVDANGLKMVQEPSRDLLNQPLAVAASLRTLNMLCSPFEYKAKAVEEGAVDSCVTAMRINADKPVVFEGALEVLSTLASVDDLAGAICNKGGTRQILKGLTDNISSPSFEKATELSLIVLEKVAKASAQHKTIPTLVKQGAIGTVIASMEAFPRNEVIEVTGARLLALLLSKEGVEEAVEKMKDLIGKVITGKNDDALPEVGRSAALVGYLALAPENKPIMQQKQAPGKLIAGLKAVQDMPDTANRQQAKRAMMRALGQMLAADPSGISPDMTKYLKAALTDDKNSPLEKAAALDAIKNMATDTGLANDLIKEGVMGDILKLMKEHGHDEALMAAALGAIGALTEKEAGAKAFTDLGGREVVTRWLRDNKETAGPRAIEAAMIALANLALLDSNVPKMMQDGVVDMVVAAMDSLCLDPLNPQPKVMNAAIAVMGRLATNEAAIKELVNKGALQRAIQISRSNPAYLGDVDCMEGLIFLLESCALVPAVRPEMVRAGAIDLIVEAMNANQGNEEVVITGARALQSILGSNPDAIKEVLKEVNDLAAKLKKNPNDKDLQDQLDKALQNLGNMMIIPGVVTNANAKDIAHALADVLTSLAALPDGPVKAKLVQKGVTALGRIPLVEGVQFDESEALKKLIEALRATDNPTTQENILTAITNLINGPKGLKALSALNGIDDIARIMQLAADDAKLREAARRAMEKMRKVAEEDPANVDKDMMNALIKGFGGDSAGLRDMLKRMMTNGKGVFGNLATMKLDQDITADLLRALRDGGGGMELSAIDGDILKALLAALKAGGDKAKEALKTIAMMSPAALLEFAKMGGMEGLMKMMMDNLNNPEDVSQILMTIAKMGAFDPNTTAKLLQQNGGVEKLKQVLEKHGDNPDIVRQAIGLIDLMNKVNGPKNLGVDNSLLNLIEGLAMKHGLEGLSKDALDALRNELGVGGPEMIESQLDLAIKGLAENPFEERKDDDGKVYYFDKKSGQTHWQKPQAYAAVISAMEGLAKLTEAHKEHITAVNPKALTAAVGQIEVNKNEPAKLTALAKALATLASNAENRNAIAKAGGLQAIIQALNADILDPEFVEAAINLLNQMSKNEQFRDQIAKLGGIKALIRIMLKFIEHKQVVERCLSALANLGFNNDANVAEIILHDGIAATLKVMKRWKEQTSTLQLALVLINNLMYENNANKLRIGQEAGPEIVEVCARWHKDVKTFNAANKCMGSLSMHDENIRMLVDCHAVRHLVAGMDANPDDVGAQQIAIDVIGNFASIQDDKNQAKILKGEIPSVFDIIVSEGGAARILKTLKQTAEVNLLMSGMDALANLANDQKATQKMLQLGIVPMVVNAMSAYDWDEELMARTVRLLATLTFNPDGVKEIVARNGIQVVLTGMESHMEEPEFIISAIVALKNISGNAEYRTEIGKLGGVETILAAFERHIDHRPLVMELILLLVRMTMNTASSEAIATKGMHVILKSIHGRSNDAEFLTRAFILLGHLAFHDPNLKIIAQYGGVALIIEGICNHPESREMLLKAVQTLDNIAMASVEHSKIVVSEGGKDAVVAVADAYSGDSEVVQICKSAILTMSALDASAAKPRRNFQQNQDDGLVKGEDPLKPFRNMLKAGSVMTEWSNGGPNPRHVLIDQSMQNLIWKDTKKGTKGNQMPLRDIRVIRSGTAEGHSAGKNKKAKPENSFSIVGRAFTLDLECDSPEIAKAWIQAMNGVMHCVKRDPQWLR